MTFSEFSITLSKNIFIENLKKSTKFVYFFTTYNAKPDVDRIVYLIELVFMNSIVWKACFCSRAILFGL